jgi:hypothetical protein
MFGAGVPAVAADGKPDGVSAKATPEQKKFVADQLGKLKNRDLFADDAQTNPKVVVDALVGKGKELLPALKEALPEQNGKAREACARAILLLSWGFDPEEKVAATIKQAAGGKALPESARRQAMSDGALGRVFPDVQWWSLTLGADAKPAGLGTLKPGNLVTLTRDGNVSILNTSKALELLFRSRFKPAEGGQPGPAIAEPQAREILSVWLTLGSVIASDGQNTFRPAPDTFSIKQNGPRWVLLGRAVPTGPAAEKLGQRQLLVILNSDGAILSVTESSGLRPIRR